MDRPEDTNMANEEQVNAERLDLVQEYAQGLVEVLVSNEVLEHIPVVKTITATVKAMGTVRDAILLQKIKAFIAALPKVPAAQRIDMVRRLETDPGYNRNVGLHLVELLDRIDGHRKPTMIGRVFAAYALGNINVAALHRLIAGIERLPSHEIDAVRRVGNAVTTEPQDLGSVDPESIYAMINAGLAYIESGWGGGGLKVTPTCSLFLELNLDRKSTN
jgi:hypothetical protein